MHGSSLTMPAHELLSQEPEGDHQELQVEPLVPEPQEEVDAEDDGEGTEPEHVGLSPSPGEQNVERVGEGELGGEEPGEVVDGPPVPAPVGEYGRLD